MYNVEYVEVIETGVIGVIAANGEKYIQVYPFINGELHLNKPIYFTHKEVRLLGESYHKPFSIGFMSSDIEAINKDLNIISRKKGLKNLL